MGEDARVTGGGIGRVIIHNHLKFHRLNKNHTVDKRINSLLIYGARFHYQ